MAIQVKTPNEIDIEVGQKIKIRRRAIGMSQQTLGNALGITFQQVQKYEKGTNRVGASRLAHVANVLGVTISYFFPDQKEGINGSEDSVHDDTIIRFLSTNEGRDLNRAFARIEAIQVKRSVVALVKSLADGIAGPAVL